MQHDCGEDTCIRSCLLAHLSDDYLREPHQHPGSLLLHCGVCNLLQQGKSAPGRVVAQQAEVALQVALVVLDVARRRHRRVRDLLQRRRQARLAAHLVGALKNKFRRS